jgi:CheY-like chemotaxis protein
MRPRQQAGALRLCTTIPRHDYNRTVMLGEYHFWLWRKHSSQLSPADAETQTGDGHLSPLLASLPPLSNYCLALQVRQSHRSYASFTEAPLPPSEKRIRTLVIDDDADYVRYLCAFLETLSNVDVITRGRSGRDAVVLAHEWVPDLVLMDVRMPELTGLEVASQLARELPDVIVILMSAFEAEGIWRASQKSGAFAFVMKENLTHDLPRLLELAASERGWNKPSQNCA